MRDLFAHNRQLARKMWEGLGPQSIASLKRYSEELRLSIAFSEIVFLSGSWYITHAGLMRLANRRRCCGIEVEAVPELCDSAARRYIFKATVHTYRKRRAFVGYGDADPSNCSSLVQGAEMRVAETRAVNRALRKAYGIGICSVEEIGSFSGPAKANRESKQPGKLPPQPVNGSGSGGHGYNGNGNGSRVRDRLCQIIRRHALDAELVKVYAIDFCGTKTLREASREQVEQFVTHLADLAEKDRNALLCQLNNYSRSEAGAA
jgi:hypothetical protein